MRRGPRIRAGKVAGTYTITSPHAPQGHEAMRVLNNYYAALRLAKQRKTPQWKLARATANNRFILLGEPYSRLKGVPQR